MDHTGVGWVMQGRGSSYRGGVGQAEVGWVMQGWVGHAGLGWGGVGMGWVCRCGVGWGGSCRMGSGASSRGGVRWVIQRWNGVGHEKY